MPDYAFTRRAALTGMVTAPALAGQQSPSAGSQDTAFTNVTVIDGTGGILRDQTVIIDKDLIAAVGATATTAVPSGSHVVDGHGRFLIPGHWDAHAHLCYFRASALPAFVANGVTSIRDMGGLLGELDEWKGETNLGTRPSRAMPTSVCKRKARK